MKLSFICLPTGKILKVSNTCIIPIKDNIITVCDNNYFVEDIRINYDTDNCNVFLKQAFLDPVARAILD